MKHLVLALGLMILGCAKEEAKLPTWTFSGYAACKMKINPELDRLPFDIATNLNRTDMTRYDALQSTRGWMITKDLEQIDLSEGLLDDAHPGEVSAMVYAASKEKLLVIRGWQDPQHALYEEREGDFHVDPAFYRFDIYSKDARTSETKNLTAENEVSYYHGMALVNPSKNDEVMFSAMIGNEMRLFKMNLDGTGKAPLSATAGFAYGLSVSPNGQKYAYHSNYQIVIGDFSTGIEKTVQTPCGFNFGPKWSPNSSKIVFLCGSNYFTANADGSEVAYLSSKLGYSGAVALFQGFDFHGGGGTDSYVWTSDSKSVVHSANIGGSVELVRANLNGLQEQLTFSEAGSRNQYPNISKDGKWVIYHANKGDSGKMNDMYILNLNTNEEIQVTDLDRGCNSRLAFGL